LPPPKHTHQHFLVLLKHPERISKVLTLWKTPNLLFSSHQGS